MQIYEIISGSHFEILIKDDSFFFKERKGRRIFATRHEN
jgi:hypothetical protein